MENLRIEPNFYGEGTEVTSYKVVDENRGILMIGSYSDCYYYLFPDSDNNYADKEGFEKAYNIYQHAYLNGAKAALKDEIKHIKR